MHESVLIIAGYGAMGRAFVRLFNAYVTSFRTCYVIDLELPPEHDAPVRFVDLDVTDCSALRRFLSGIKSPILFINLTAGIDTVMLRSILCEYGTCYLDTSCSMIAGSDEYRFSRLMPYTYTDLDNDNVHLLCCGVNPGLVEILIRRIAREHFTKSRGLEIMLYERDTISADKAAGSRIPVSWSVDTLIDEVLLSPTMEIRGGKLREKPHPPAEPARVNWFGEIIDSRLVGHEEIWNMRQVEGVPVRRCAYAYSFSDPVMRVLRAGENTARRTLYIPDMEEAIRGEDSLVIQVADPDSGREKTFAWRLDHHETWQSHGVNAVQFQVCASVRLFCEIMTSSAFRPGKLAHGSTIPVDDSSWQMISSLFDRFAINWQEVAGSRIHLLPPARAG